MNLGLILELLNSTIKLVGGELGSRYERKAIKLREEYHEELSKPDSERSDLALNRILFESNNIARAIIAYRKE